MNKKNGSDIMKKGEVLFTKFDRYDFYRSQKFGLLYPFARKVYFSLRKIFTGKVAFEDQIKLACMCEPPMFFLQYGIMIAHAYGITLSADKIGCDVDIGQNVTIGSNGKYIPVGGGTSGHKPKIGNLVRVYPNSIISGEIEIGDCVLIAAGSVVTRDVPSKSIVYGRNVIKPLRLHHVNYLKSILFHCMRQYVKVDGLMYRDNCLYIDTDYLKKRVKLIEALTQDNFGDVIGDLF